MLHYITYKLHQDDYYNLTPEILSYDYCDISEIPFGDFTNFIVKEVKINYEVGDGTTYYLIVNDMDAYIKIKLKDYGYLPKTLFPTFLRHLEQHIRAHKLKDILS